VQYRVTEHSVQANLLSFPHAAQGVVALGFIFAVAALDEQGLDSHTASVSTRESHGGAWWKHSNVRRLTKELVSLTAVCLDVRTTEQS
jgi:hypothetical protein